MVLAKEIHAYINIYTQIYLKDLVGTQVFFHLFYTVRNALTAESDVAASRRLKPVLFIPVVSYYSLLKTKKMFGGPLLEAY